MPPSSSSSPGLKRFPLLVRRSRPVSPRTTPQFSTLTRPHHRSLPQPINHTNCRPQLSPRCSAHPSLAVSFAMPQSTTPKKAPVPPRPSASILLISPTNEVLLLHRVQTSSSFPSAHVFPGGNCEAFHDGDVPAPEDPARHIDGPVYRWAGIRECFEESGLLLAKRKGEDSLASIEKEERERVRKDVHNGKRKFGDVLKEWGVAPDLGESEHHPV